MEDSFEEEVKVLWDSISGELLSRLEQLKIGLIKWASLIKSKRNGHKKELTK